MLNMYSIFILGIDSKVVTQSLEIMWKGMLAIFVAVALIYLGIYIMSAINKKLKENKAKKLAMKEKNAQDNGQN